MFFFLTTLIVYSIKKVHETCWYGHSEACKGKRTGYLHRLLTFNDKNLLYPPIILTLQIFW